MFISSRFMRGIILASICLFYSTHSLSLAREKSGSFVTNNLIAAKSLCSMLIWKFISPIYRFFYSEKTQNILNNFDRLIKLPEGRDLIKDIIEKYPDARQQITPYIVSNFDRLIEFENGRLLIANIIERYPDARQQIISHIVSFFDRVGNLGNKSFYGKLFIENIIKNIIERYPDARQQIISHIVSNFDRLIESPRAIDLIKSIIEKYPDARQQIIPRIVKNLDRLIESLGGIYLIKGIIEKYPDARQQIIPRIVNNFDRLIELENGIVLIHAIIKNDPSARQQIAKWTVSNIERLIEFRNGRLLIKNIIENDPSARQQIALSVVEFPYPNRWKVIKYFEESQKAQIISSIKENYKEKKITKLPLSIFSYLCEKFPQDECLRNRLKEDSQKYSIEGVIKRILYLKSCPEGKSDRLKSSLPTVKHIERYRKSIAQFIDNNAFSSNFLSMLDRTFRKEVELEKSGYIAFKHAQRWGYGLPEKWFTTLWAITKEKSITDFIFLHVKPLLKDNNFADETEMRERLLTSGRSSTDDRQHLLFMNYALFGNTDNLGSSSVSYAADNSNVGSINVSLENVFNYLGHEDIYKKYEKQLQGLEQEHQGLSKHGSMVVVGVPENKLADSVYFTTSGGPKKKIHIEGIGETDDIKAIIRTLRHAPEKIKDSDQMEFALIMTQDKHGGLNPESGIKVHLFDAADPERLAVFRKKESLLLEQIKQEIRQEKSKESAATAGQFIRSAL